MLGPRQLRAAAMAHTKLPFIESSRIPDVLVHDYSIETQIWNGSHTTKATRR